MELHRPWTPGYFDTKLEADAAVALGALAETIVPGDTKHPSATDAGVVMFIESHADPKEAAVLSDFAISWQSAGGGEDVLRSFEETRPEEFALARFYVYSGYYCSPVVIENLRTNGSDYHLSPQPLGYQIDAEVPIPTQTRGVFVPTQEVRYVFQP